MTAIKRRNQNAVAVQILKVCKEGASKTRVIYKANLNSATGKEYLNNLTKDGLIEVIPDGSRFIYRTTSKGKELQQMLGQFQNIMDQLYSNT